MREIGIGVFAAILIALSIWDFLTRKVPVVVLSGAVILAIIYHIISADINIFLILTGAGVGLLFCLLSRITRQRIGYGDGFTILFLGIFQGLWGILTTLCAAFILLLPAAMIKFMRKKRNSELPFIPFLAAGFILTMILN
ncbi:MAG: prepilin peptidase [Lachnospiraceae bacterium]|jgi:leader peptidase (prepilin peptidase)/N-methyltransferase|nr:prepilin peptidase [Lachnospiraceae bacterium]